MYQHPAFVWVVYDRCDCEAACYGREDIAVFTNEQTAKQEAEMRSKRYGGLAGRPDMHMDKVKISTKISGF